MIIKFNSNYIDDTKNDGAVGKQQTSNVNNDLYSYLTSKIINSVDIEKNMYFNIYILRFKEWIPVDKG